MKPLNICGITGFATEANVVSDVISQGTYDVYAPELSVIRVNTADKMSGITEKNGYTIPAGAVITLVIDRSNMRIQSTTPVRVHRVGGL